MDLGIVKEHLALAEQHVAQGHEHVAKQRRIVADLETDGHVDAAVKGRALLAEFEKLLAMHIADRDRLRKELGECPS